MRRLINVGLQPTADIKQRDKFGHNNKNERKEVGTTESMSQVSRGELELATCKTTTGDLTSPLREVLHTKIDEQSSFIKELPFAEEWEVEKAQESMEEKEQREITEKGEVEDELASVKREIEMGEMRSPSREVSTILLESKDDKSIEVQTHRKQTKQQSTRRTQNTMDGCVESRD